MSRTMFIIAALLIVGGWLVIFMMPSLPDNLNEIGDSFGIVNALFSGLALLAIVYSLALQRDEIRKSSEQIDRQGQTIQELKQAITNQSDVLKDSVDAQKAQVAKLAELVVAYQQHLEPLKQQADAETSRLQHERIEWTRNRLQHCWDKLEKGLAEAEGWEARDQLYTDSGYQQALRDLLESRPERAKTVLSPAQKTFLMEHLFQPGIGQEHFKNEAYILSHHQSLGTIPNERLTNFKTARAVARTRFGVGSDQTAEYMPS